MFSLAHACTVDTVESYNGNILNFFYWDEIFIGLLMSIYVDLTVE